jgi:hypothetical protein
MDRSAEIRARRREVGLRAVIAILGGYVATALVTGILARVLPLQRGDATTLAMLLSFLVYAALVMAVFAAASTRRAWLVVLAPAGACGVLLLLVGGTP